jgi:hypothetical protein
MKEHSRIRFNPATKEVEVEGSEGFVKEYFDKLQALMSGSPKKVAKESIEKKPRVAMKTGKALVKEPGEKKPTNISTVVGLIQASREGISTAEIKAKTGLAESQIWNIVARATKEGKIKKGKRGLYVRV